MVRTSGLMGANAVPNYVQIAPGDDAIDQPITAAILKIRFAEAQPHKGPCKEDTGTPLDRHNLRNGSTLESQRYNGPFNGRSTKEIGLSTTSVRRTLSMKRTPFCQLPATMTVTGRSSSLTNAFINGIIPVIQPTEAEELEALRILGIDPVDIRCAYCGDKSTEWDHLRPIITNQEPTGYITEIANLVPSCGKCNQSKGKSSWRAWITSTARLYCLTS